MGTLLLVVVDLLSFLLILGLGFLLPQPVVWTLSVLWGLWVVWSCWKRLSSGQDVPFQLARLATGKSRMFRDQVEVLIRAWGTVESKAGFFEGQTEPVRHAYGLVRDRVASDMESALRYIQTYDYASRPDYHILLELAGDARDMAAKLNRLSDYVFRIDEGAGDVDVSGLDDLLAALEAMSRDSG